MKTGYRILNRCNEGIYGYFCGTLKIKRDFVVNSFYLSSLHSDFFAKALIQGSFLSQCAVTPNLKNEIQH